MNSILAFSVPMVLIRSVAANLAHQKSTNKLQAIKDDVYDVSNLAEKLTTEIH